MSKEPRLLQSNTSTDRPAAFDELIKKEVEFLTEGMREIALRRRERALRKMQREARHPSRK